MAGEETRIIYCWKRRLEGLDVYLASSPKGALKVGLSLKGGGDCLDYFGALWPERELKKDRNRNGPLIEALEAAWHNRPGPQLRFLDVEGTPFQRKVWKAISRIPFGQTRSYAEVARSVGNPSAARAIGQAMGRNPLPIIYP